ncbi:MAG TPA: reverse transcriptase domain-containing protein [Candidatus Saccharimonadales bacterium]
MTTSRYPKIHIQSKNEFAKHISSRRFPYTEALRLINDVQANFDKYWHDHPTMSQPEKGKWVRNAKGTKLGILLKAINERILRPNDYLVPDFIFGGIGGLDHKAAVKHLLGKRRKRILLKLDVAKFFEQMHYERVYHFFLDKTGCSDKGARILAELCCVPYGPKDSPANYKTIGRGFSTSSRLAVWCNIDTFLKLERLVKKELKGKDPRIAIYVDDIGITASRATKEDMMKLYPKIKAILEGDRNQKLPLNEAKTRIIYHSGDTYNIEGKYLGKWCFEHLGLQMNRDSVGLGSKTRWKLANKTQQYKASHKKDQQLKRSRKSTLIYKNYIEK